MAGTLAPAGRCGPEGAAGARATETPAAVAAPTVAAAPAPPADPTPSADLFASSVRPVLLAHCAPCHEPGGKLYEKLPFDDAAVVASHSAGVLKRLKGENREAVEKWLATLPTPAPK